MASDLTTERMVEAGARAVADDSPGCIASSMPCDEQCICRSNTIEALRAILAEAGVDAAGLRICADALQDGDAPAEAALLRALAGVLGDE